MYFSSLLNSYQLIGQGLQVHIFIFYLMHLVRPLFCILPITQRLHRKVVIRPQEWQADKNPMAACYDLAFLMNVWLLEFPGRGGVLRNDSTQNFHPVVHGSVLVGELQKLSPPLPPTCFVHNINQIGSSWIHLLINCTKISEESLAWKTRIVLYMSSQILAIVYTLNGLV